MNKYMYVYIIIIHHNRYLISVYIRKNIRFTIRILRIFVKISMDIRIQSVHTPIYRNTNRQEPTIRGDLNSHIGTNNNNH